MRKDKFITDLYSSLEKLQKSGQKEIPIINLKRYLADIKEQHDAHNESALKEFETSMEYFRANHATQLEMFKSVIEAGLNALRSAIIINGGASIALLAFAGQLLINGYSDGVLSQVGFALFIFVSGTGLAGIAMGVRYLTQFCYAQTLEDSIAGKKSCWDRIRKAFNILSILCGVGSFLAFFWGGYLAYKSLIL